MVLYCKREGCGHPEDDHALSVDRTSRLRCRLTVPSGNGMASCPCVAFLAEEPPKSERAAPKLKSVPPAPPEPMSAVALDLLQQGLAQRGEVKDFEVVHGQKVEPAAVPMRGVELDLKITLAGKVRTLTELAAAANVLVRETGCDDLADAATALAKDLAVARSTIGALRGQLAAGVMKDSTRRQLLVELQFNIAAESADPETLASKLRAVCEAAAKVGGM